MTVFGLQGGINLIIDNLQGLAGLPRPVHTFEQVGEESLRAGDGLLAARGRRERRATSRYELLRAQLAHARERVTTAPISQPLNRLVQACWNLEQLALGYQRFLERFRPVWRALKSAQHLDPQQCFLVRTLLIHQVRRLSRNLYRLTYRLAEEHLSRVLQTAEGPLPGPAHYFYQRFGGLT